VRLATKKRLGDLLEEGVLKFASRDMKPGEKMGCRILIIEDDRPSLELFTYLLKAFSHTTLPAESAEEGLEIARRERPDLIVCDVLLPRMDGFDLIKVLRADERLRNIPVIAVTILTDSGDRERLISAGFNDYIPKPIWSDKFVSQIEKSFCNTLGNRH
jgi:CheY-like chemotaxis protein